MSHSTTVTSTHTLLKYSKSYPPASSTQAITDNNTEWQHFTNPILRLVLDMRKSSNAELESVRLRILWSMNGTTDINQNEVVFEDIDLLSFSLLPPLPPHNPQQKQHPQGLPLKAVYRDAVVGIRYLNPCILPTDSTLVYRRFQITFVTASAASEFINAIRNVCPCKANPTNGNGRNITIITNPSSTNTTTTAQASIAAMEPLQPRAVDSAYIPTSITDPPLCLPTTSHLRTNTTSYLGSLSSPSFIPSSSQNGVRAIHHSSSPFDFTTRPSTFSPCSNISALQLSRNAPLEHSLAHDQSQFANTIQNLPRYYTPPHKPIAQNMSKDLSPYSVALSSASVNTNNGEMPPSLPLNADMQSDASPAFVASVREATGLYDLSEPDLELLVSKIVREDGFAKLVRLRGVPDSDIHIRTQLQSLDSMWRIKGYLSR